jgi:hypothetical protein
VCTFADSSRSIAGARREVIDGLPFVPHDPLLPPIVSWSSRIVRLQGSEGCSM